MKTISKKKIILLIVVVTLLLGIACFYFWPISNVVKDKMGISVNDTDLSVNTTVGNSAPEVIQLSSTSDKIYRCVSPLGGYNVMHKIPDGGSSLYNHAGNLLCHKGGIDPSSQQGDCSSFQLCFPVYDQS